MSWDRYPQVLQGTLPACSLAEESSYHRLIKRRILYGQLLFIEIRNYGCNARQRFITEAGVRG